MDDPFFGASVTWQPLRESSHSLYQNVKTLPSLSSAGATRNATSQSCGSGTRENSGAGKADHLSGQAISSSSRKTKPTDGSTVAWFDNYYDDFLSASLFLTSLLAYITRSSKQRQRENMENLGLCGRCLDCYDAGRERRERHGCSGQQHLESKMG
jgi:hypothetical protein